MKALLTALAALALPALAAEPPTYADVAPIFAARCIVCHSGANAPRGLVLDGYDAIMRGGQRGPAVVPGAARSSTLVGRIRGEIQPRMPLTGPPWLSDAEIALIAAWIDGGARRGEAPPTPAAAPQRPAAPGPGEPVTWAHVAPIFAQRCVKCHTDNGLMGPPPEGLRLNAYEQVLMAGERARVIPGVAGASELVRRIKGLSQPRMPFDGPPWLSDDEIALIERWVSDGARNSEGKAAPVPAGARVRFEGTLTGEWEVDGTPVVVDSGTRIDKRPRTGDRVELRGIVLSNGSVRVERLRRR